MRTQEIYDAAMDLAPAVEGAGIVRMEVDNGVNL